MVNMVQWHNFIADDFEWDGSIDEKLSHHGITFEEALECFDNPFRVKKNQKFSDRFQLLGRTDSGRSLKIIFQLKQDNIVRIITGWDR